MKLLFYLVFAQLFVLANSFGIQYHDRCRTMSNLVQSRRPTIRTWNIHRSTNMQADDRVPDVGFNAAEISPAASMCGIPKVPSFLQQQQNLVSQAIPGAQPRIDWSGALSDSGPVIPRVMNGVKGSDMPAALKEIERSGRSRPDWFRVPAPPPSNVETKYAKLKDSLQSLRLHTVRS
jgi:hypothetical protein